MSVDEEQQRNTLARMSSASVLTKNTFANLVKPGVSWLVVLVLPPLLVRVLDKPSYATWMLLLQISAYITLVEGSVERVTMHFVARGRGLDDYDYMGRMVSSAAIVLLIVGAIATVGTIFTAARLDVLFHSIPSAILPDASKALLVTAISIAAALPFSVYSGVFRGYQRNEVPTIATTVGKILGSLGVGWAAFHHQSLTSMAIWTAFGTLLTRGLYYAMWRRSAMRGMLHLSRVTGRAMREFAKIWSATLASQFCGILISGLDLPVVAAFDFRSAGYYAVAATLNNILLVPQMAVVDAILPVMSSLSASASPRAIGSALTRLARYNSALLILIILPLVFGLGIVLPIWVTNSYAVHVLPLAIALLLAQFVRSCMSPYSMVAFTAGQQEKTLISPVVEGVVNVGVSLFLVHRIGAFGVAIGTVIGSFVGFLLHIFVSMRLTTAIEVSQSEFLLAGILRPLGCAFPAVIFMWFALRLHPGIPMQLLVLAMGEVIAAALLFKGNFKTSEREQISCRVRAVLASLRLPVITGTS